MIIVYIYYPNCSVCNVLDTTHKISQITQVVGMYSDTVYLEALSKEDKLTLAMINLVDHTVSVLATYASRLKPFRLGSSITKFQPSSQTVLYVLSGGTLYRFGKEILDVVHTSVFNLEIVIS